MGQAGCGERQARMALDTRALQRRGPSSALLGPLP